jgi:hypothetical protein
LSEGPAQAADDPHVARLARLFASHPVWCEAARRIHEDARSSVYFRHRPGEPWRLVRRAGGTLLEPGPAEDPDLAFCFPPEAIETLAQTRGSVADFALALFRLALEDDPERRVRIRVIAPFPRLLRRGYVDLLLRGGPKLLWFGATHGVRTLGQLRRLVDALRRSEPEEWEREASHS